MGNACYVYAIVDRATPLPAGGAVDGVAELAMVPWGRLAAVTGSMEDGGAPLRVEAVLRHEAVVEAVRRQGPALPVRFGTMFRDATAIASALAEKYEPLAADLDRLGDKVELSLSALWHAQSVGAEPTTVHADEATEAKLGAGARYMYVRAAELRREEALKARARLVVRALEEALGAFALDRRLSLLPTPRVAVRAAYLLEPGGVDAFRDAVERLRRTPEAPRLLLTGPWPPYSFVGRAGSGGGGASGDGLGALVELLTNEMRDRLG